MLGTGIGSYFVDVSGMNNSLDRKCSAVFFDYILSST